MSTVIYLENGLNPQNRRVEQHKGSIQDLAPDWQIPYVAFVDGRAVLRADWELVIEEDQTLAFIEVGAIPQGGGGGSNPLRTILMIAVMVAAPYAAGALYGAMGGTLVMANAGMILSGMTAAIGMAGMALVNALVPPPKLPTPQQAAALAAPSPTYSLQAQGNTARLEAAIPEHFGRHICYPDFAAQPYTEFAGNEQYLYQLLCVGRGEYDLSDFRIEDTEIESFNEVTYEIVRPGETLDLFPADVVSSIEVSGQTMDGGVYVGPFVASGVGTTANYIGIDFIAPKGLFYATDDGSLASVTATATVEARLVDDYGNPAGGWVALTDQTYYSPWSDWTGYNNPALQVWTTLAGRPVLVQNYPGDSTTVEYRRRKSFIPVKTYVGAEYRTRTVSPQVETFTAATNTPQRYSRRYPIAPGRYEARVKRIDTEQTSSRYGHTLMWGGMRAYLKDDTRTFGDVTLIGMRMRASDNLSMQSSRKFNCIATRKLPIWNGSAWSGLTATRNPAWAITYACKQVGLTDAQIDLSGLLTLANDCTARGDNFDARFDNFLSFWEAVSKMAGAVRAKPFMQAGVLRVVRDQAATIPVAMFSQRNIVKGSLSINYLMPTEDTADSVDVGYFDEVTWKPARVRSTLAGSTALKPAKVDLFGVTNRNKAWKEGLHQAACNRYRRKIISFSTEMEGFIPSFGDLVAIQHDMPAWGQGGEVVAWDAGTKTLILSEPPTFSTGTHYIALRKRDGSVDGPYACTPTLDPYAVALSTTPAITPYTGQMEERTHYAFGAGIAWRQPARVLSAKPLNLYTVEIQAVNEDDSVHTADSGLTMPVQVFTQLAGYTNAPTVTGVTARFLFNYPNMATVTWVPAPWADHYEVQSSSGDGAWTHCGNTSGTSLTFTATYGSTTLVRVAASGVARGVWQEANIAVVPPFDPTGLVYTQELGGVRIKWDERLEINFYELRVGGTSWETATPVAPVTGTEYLWAAQTAGTYTLRLKSIDVNGNYCANALSQSVIVVGPGAPDVSFSVSGTDEVLSWTIPSSGFSVDRYEIRLGASWAAGTKVDSTKATSYRRKVDYVGARTYWVAAVDVVGNYGVADSVAVNINAPGVVVGSRVEVVDNNVLVFWNPPATGTLPVDRYEVRKGASWAVGTVVGSNGNSTFAAVFEQSGGTYTYWIAAVDSAANFGTAASAVATVSQPPDYILRDDFNSAFGGTKVNALPFEGGLLLPVNTTETWTQHFSNNSYATPQAQITAGNPLYIEPSLGTASYTEAIDYGTTLPATTISVTLNSMAVAGTVSASCQIKYSNTSASGPWTSAPAGATSTLATNFRWVEVTYTFTGAGGHHLLKVNALNIKLAVKNRTDSGAGTITNAAAGVWVPFGYTFIDADTPMVQPQGAVPLIPVVDYADNPNPTGFTVYLYTTAGIKTTGSFSWTVRGF